MTSTPTQGLDARALEKAVLAYDEARCSTHGPHTARMSAMNRQTITPMIGDAIFAYLAALPASSGGDDYRELREAVFEAVRKILDREKAPEHESPRGYSAMGVRSLVQTAFTEAEFALSALSTSAKRGNPNPTEQSSSPADVETFDEWWGRQEFGVITGKEIAMEAWHAARRMAGGER